MNYIIREFVRDMYVLNTDFRTYFASPNNPNSLFTRHIHHAQLFTSMESAENAINSLHHVRIVKDLRIVEYDLFGSLEILRMKTVTRQY